MAIENINPIGPAGSGQTPGEPLDELLLSRYMDGRLSDTEVHTLEERLRTDPVSRRRLDALREEERLLREALEPASEPSRRLGDKVIAVLHAEERQRQQDVRGRRVRRHVFTLLAAAASLLVCVWLVRPRDSVGTAVSGTAATVVTLNNDRRPLTADGRFYEGDQIITAEGQFVRLRLASGAVLDLDEHSRLSIEKARPLPTLRLENGRMGVSSPQGDVLVHVPQGAVQVTAGALADVWLPRPAEVIWPDALSATNEKVIAAIPKACFIVIFISAAFQSPCGKRCHRGAVSSQR